MCSFCAKNILFEYTGVIFHETKEEYKIWRGINLSFKNWHNRNLTNFNLNTRKFQKFSLSWAPFE